MSSVDALAEQAVDKAFKLANAERKDCPTGKLPPFPFQAESFLQGAEHTHYVHVHHKYDSSCGSETYKLHFYVSTAGPQEKGDAGTEDSSFVMQVNRDMKSKSWTLLASDPAPCDIRVGSASAPQSVSRTSKAMMRAAKFAARELSYAMQKGGCLPEEAKEKGLEVARVKQAVATVLAGVKMEFVLALKAGDSE